MSKYQYVYNHAKVGMAVWSIKDYRFKFINPAFASIHGYESHELLGTDVRNIFTPQSLKHVSTSANNPSYGISHEIFFETIHTKKDGINIPLNVHITTIKDNDGVPKHHIANVIDLSKNDKNTLCESPHNTSDNTNITLNETNFFNFILQNLPGFAFIFQLHANGKEEFLYASDKILDTYGIDASTVLSDITKLRKLFHPDDITRFKAAIEESAKNLQLFHAEFRINHPQKGEIWLETNSTPHAQADGSTIWYGITMEISQRKKIELALMKTTTHLSSLVNTIPDLVWMKDENGVYLACNHEFERFFGAKERDILGKTDYDFISPALADFFRQKDKEAIEKKYIITNEERIVYQATGEEGLLETRKAPVYDKNGELLGVLGIAKDITKRHEMEEKLAKKEEEFRTIAERTPDTIVRFDRECRRTYINPSAMRIAGVPQEELLGLKPSSFSPLNDALLFENTLRYAIQTGEEATLEMAFASPTGYTGWRHMHIVPETNIHGEVTSVLAIGRDISERKKIELQLKDNETIFQEAQRIAKIGSWKLDLATQAITWSDEMYRIFNIDPTTTRSLRKLFIEMIHPEDMTHVKELHYQAQKNHVPYETTHRVLLKNGTLKYIHAKAITYYDNHENAISIMGTVQDVTEQKMVEKQVEFLASHDTLTELPNRMLAQSRCEQSIAYAKRSHSKIALLFIDLDDFKTINDSLGHALGHVMLKMVAKRLKQHIRQTDTLSRQGGDEFLMILTDVRDVEDVSAVALKLLGEFEKPFHLDEHILSSSISVGIALYPDDGKHFEPLLQRADTAMYKAKEAGRNTYCFFTEAMNQEIFAHLTLQNDLKQALVQQQFVLHYQPQVDLKTNTINGVEALIRWLHPQNGLVPPTQFISIAESTGLIFDIGEWVIREACHQASKWHQQGMKITMAVNISAVQFKRGNLERVIEKALEDSGLNPHYLELELTESILIHDTENVLYTIRKLKNLGIKLSIDDFGTGYSSLSYLKRFAVDKLKIDQSFVRDILKDQEDDAIVQAIIQMAKSLNLKTVAEGVEAKEILEILKHHGCDAVQGYYFAKPMNATDFSHYFSQRESTK